jgi:hypothetical protein
MGDGVPPSSVRTDEGQQGLPTQEPAEDVVTNRPRRRLLVSPRVVVQVVAWCGGYLALLSLLLYVGRHTQIPLPNPADPDAGEGLSVAIRQLLGRPDRRDFLLDYASAHALIHGVDAYASSASLIHGVGLSWAAVVGANPHPPTLLTLVLPFTWLKYGAALAAWALAMVGALLATLRLVGVPLWYAAGIAVALAITFPGAAGIGNPVPLIGLGIALAYRYRHNPVVAGLGIALAAAPKGSGLILALPFLLAGRIRTCVYAAIFYVLSAVIPLIWQGDIWSRYLDAGIKTLDANAHDRADNASLLYLAHRLWGLSYNTTVVVLVVVAVGLVIIQRDLFWPTAWASVAVLPIGWMYSLLTLLPLVAFAVLRSPRRTVGLAAAATGLACASPPNGDWPTVTYPIVLALVTAMYLLMDVRQSTLWLPPQVLRHLPRRFQLPAATG